MRRFRLPSKASFWLVACVLAAFFGASVLPSVQGMFISPDATANTFFAETLVHTGEMKQYSALNESLGDVLYPRSTVSVDGSVLPGSFLGLPVLYGGIGSLFGVEVIPWITLVVSGLAVLAWWGIMKQWFKREVAFLSSVLLAFMPAWWYYTARSMMHNVLFVSLGIFSVYFLSARPFRKRLSWLNEICAGLLLGGALFVRSSELMWMVLAALLLVVLFRKVFCWKRAVIFLVALVIGLLPLFVFQWQTYGSPFLTGYTVGVGELGRGAVELEGLTQGTQELEGVGVSVWQSVYDSLFPFGIHERLALEHTWWYVGWLFWWLAIPAILGGLLFVYRGTRNKILKKIHWTYLGVFLVISAWLTITYGSWAFTDNPDASQITIANSYVRYWLPIYVMMTPLIATFLVWIVGFITKAVVQKVVLACLVGVLVFGNFWAVFVRGQDGLFSVREELEVSLVVREAVLSQTETDSVIVVDRSDKLFYPYRQVRYPLRDDLTYALMPEIVKEVPLYYYGITFPEVDMTYLNTQKLAELGLFIELVHTFEAESLYRITPSL